MKDYNCHDDIDFLQNYDFQEPYYMNYREDYSDEGYDTYLEGAGIYEKNVAEIMELIDTRYSNIYSYLISRGMSMGGIRYLFRYLVYYTISNAGRYPGNSMQKSYAVFNSLRSLEPWFFFSFASTYLPANTIDNIIMTIIAFTVSRITTPVAP